MAEPDELFMLKNQFYVGNYQNAISEGNLLNYLSPTLKIERDVYVYRSYLGLHNYTHVLKSIPESTSTPIALSAIKLLAMYFTDGDKELIALTLKEWLTDSNSGSNPHLLLVAGVIYTEEGKLSDALSAFHKGRTLEHKLLAFRLYAETHRQDLALKELASMKAIEEDSTCTQLAQAFSCVYKGGEQADEATLLFQELCDRFGRSCLLLIGNAAAYMALKNFAEAERLLLEALSKEPNHKDILINLIAVSAHLQKPYDEHLTSLRKASPSCAWLNKYDQLQKEYEITAAGFA